MIEALREAVAQHGAVWLALGGLVIGGLFGAVVFVTNFCAMGSLSDIHNFADWRRFRAWVLAGVTALVGAQLLQAGGVVALDKSMYLAGAGLNWTGHILGGLMFGFGMVFTGGCPSRNLARAGSGDLRSLLTLVVLGLFAFMAIGGIFAPLRAALEQATSVSRRGTEPRRRGGPGRRPRPWHRQPRCHGAGRRRGARLLLGDARFRASRVHVASGIAVGLIVVAGWALTGLAYDDMATRPVPPISLSYVRPGRRRAAMADAVHGRTHAGLRHSQPVRRADRRLRDLARHGPLPPLHLLRRRRHAAQPRRRRADGDRRRDGARVHGRPGRSRASPRWR